MAHSTVGGAVANELVVEPPPCDDGCRFRELCKVQRLACQAFAAFLSGERWQSAARKPDRARFDALFAR